MFGRRSLGQRIAQLELLCPTPSIRMIDMDTGMVTPGSSQPLEQRVEPTQYNISITDESLLENNMRIPFLLSDEICDTAKVLCKDMDNDLHKADILHEWVTEEIRYGKKKRHGRYRTSAEVMEDREGMCGELTNLYIAMARSVDLTTNYVQVTRDHKGKKVNHACATVAIPGQHFHFTLADPAYRQFDIRHQNFQPMADSEAIKYFNEYNKK